ncbi:hypothetical protein C8R46DRAFT_1226631 [Mycena filopes]|nr:hypothetical protein C8R46DRAFT_1226631 [Mycena filopes]
MSPCSHRFDIHEPVECFPARCLRLIFLAATAVPVITPFSILALWVTVTSSSSPVACWHPLAPAVTHHPFSCGSALAGVVTLRHRALASPRVLSFTHPAAAPVSSAYALPLHIGWHACYHGCGRTPWLDFLPIVPFHVDAFEADVRQRGNLDGHVTTTDDEDVSFSPLVSSAYPRPRPVVQRSPPRRCLGGARLPACYSGEPHVPVVCRLYSWLPVSDARLVDTEAPGRGRA